MTATANSMRRICIYAVGLAVVLNTIAAATQENSDSAGLALKRLWSLDDEQSKKAFIALRQLESQPTASIIEVLQDFVVQPLSTYHDRIERQHERFRVAQRISSDVEVQSSPKEWQSVAGRVKWYLVELLGSSHAEKAVPVLIKLMLPEFEIAGRNRNPEMDAIVQIGSPAIPELTKAIERGNESAKEAELFSSYSKELKRRIVLSIQRKIEEKCVIALGKIGDPEALPFLIELGHKTRSRDLLRHISDAINRINQ